MQAKLVLSLIGASFLAAFQLVQAQHPPKVAKIGELLFRSGATLGAGREVFRQSLRELGYSEGKSLVYESRSAEGKLE